MSNENEILIVLGSKRFASNTDKDVWIQPPLIGDRRTMVEGDRSVLINQADLFDEERQKSNTFRVAGKITNVFDNSVSGKTKYVPFRDNLYYTNAVANASLNNPPNANILWEGYPQFDEFTFIRGTGVEGHRNFIPKSASTYNWMVYLSYPFSSNTTQRMSFTSEKFNVTNIFTCSDGIPFVLDNGTYNGKDLIYFHCGTKHNLSAGEYVEINMPLNPSGFNNKNVFQVYDVGDGTYGSEEKVFSIFNLKYPSTQTTTGTYGTFKRIVNIENSGETKSKYYIRLHKIITNPTDCNLMSGGFENNPFPIKSKLEYSALTPNGVQRMSTKDGSKTFSFTFSKDIDILPLIDNNGKPLTSLFVSIIEKGYMGYFNPPAVNENGVKVGLDIGWDFNFQSDGIDPWWNHTSTLNKDNIPLGFYYQPANGSQIFYYNENLKEGDIIKGDFCEYNYMEQKEYVISKMYHKYSFNPTYMLDNTTLQLPSGYAYEPHHEVPIRVFSDYIELARKDEVYNIPSYAYFSEYLNTFMWRDLYTYGYIDSEGLGVDYPFINGAHYPYSNVLFLQKPILRSNNINTTLINQPITDNCE